MAKVLFSVRSSACYQQKNSFYSFFLPAFLFLICLLSAPSLPVYADVDQSSEESESEESVISNQASEVIQSEEYLPDKPFLDLPVIPNVSVDDLPEESFLPEEQISSDSASDTFSDLLSEDEYLPEESILAEDVIPDVSIDDFLLEDQDYADSLDDAKQEDNSLALMEDDDFETNIEYDEKYGKTLSGVPFALKFAYSLENNQEWNDADYNERVVFIRKWEMDDMAAKAEAEEFERVRIEEAQQRENERELTKFELEEKSELRKQVIIDKKVAEDARKAEAEGVFADAKSRMDALKNVGRIPDRPGAVKTGIETE